MNGEGSNAPGDGGPETARRRAAGPLRFAATRLAEGGAATFCAVFGHLLRQNDWARAKLAMFAGRHVCIALDAPLLGGLDAPRLVARITDDGLLDASGARQITEYDVSMRVRPSFGAATGLLRSGARGLAPYVEIDGEVMLAAALGEIAERIRWDPEEDLSRITGDVVAHRVGRGIAGARDAMRDLRDRLGAATGRRFSGESGPLVGRDELASLQAALDTLETQLSRLEGRRRHQAQPPAPSAAGESAPLPQVLPPLELPNLDFDPNPPEQSGGPASPQSPASGEPPAPGAGSGSQAQASRTDRPDPGAAGSGIG